MKKLYHETTPPPSPLSAPKRPLLSWTDVAVAAAVAALARRPPKPRRWDRTARVSIIFLRQRLCSRLKRGDRSPIVQYSAKRRRRGCVEPAPQPQPEGTRRQVHATSSSPLT